MADATQNFLKGKLHLYSEFLCQLILRDIVSNLYVNRWLGKGKNTRYSNAESVLHDSLGKKKVSSFNSCACKKNRILVQRCQKHK